MEMKALIIKHYMALIVMTSIIGTLGVLYYLETGNENVLVLSLILAFGFTTFITLVKGGFIWPANNDTERE